MIKNYKEFYKTAILTDFSKMKTSFEQTFVNLTKTMCGHFLYNFGELISEKDNWLEECGDIFKSVIC